MELILATTDTLTAEMEGDHATTAPTVYAGWLDNNSAISRQATTLTGATPVTVAPAPTTATGRMVRSLIIANLDSVAHTVTVKHVVSGGATTVVWSENIAAGATVDVLSQLREGPQGDGISTIHGMGEETTPTGDDEVIVADSTAAWIAKRLSLTNLVTYLGTALAGVFAAVADGLSGIADLDPKAAPVDADALVLADSADGDAPKSISLSDLRSAIAGPAASNWTAFTGFVAAAPGLGALNLTAQFPGVTYPGAQIGDSALAIPLRWRCDGDAAGDYRYGILRAVGGDVTHTTHSGTAQAGTYTASPFAATITLAADASATDDYYNGMYVTIPSGPGASQRAIISDYDGTSKVATLALVDGTDLLGSMAKLNWTEAADNSSVYVVHHAIVAGQPLDADDIVEMQVGKADRVGVVTFMVAGAYSDETSANGLYGTIMKGTIPWAASRARIVQVGAVNATPDGTSDPLLHVFHNSLLADNSGDGIAPADGSSNIMFLNWNEHGSIDATHAGHNQLNPNSWLDAYVQVAGGAGDGADLTVSVVSVLE